MKVEAANLLDDIRNTYSEWLEMSDEPHVMLNAILANMLYEARETNKHLNKIAYRGHNAKI